jgi:hypothetical protein
MRRRITQTRDRVRDSFTEHLDSLIEQTIKDDSSPSSAGHEAA